MDVTPLVPEGRQVVEGYGDGYFRVSGTVWQGAVIIFPDSCIAWPAGARADVVREALASEARALDLLAPVLGADAVPEILLLGCGARAAPVPAALHAAIRRRGPVLEIMDTGAACRTYNLLLAEHRRVAAALVPAGLLPPAG